MYPLSSHASRRLQDFISQNPVLLGEVSVGRQARSDPKYSVRWFCGDHQHRKHGDKGCVRSRRGTHRSSIKKSQTNTMRRRSRRTTLALQECVLTTVSSVLGHPGPNNWDPVERGLTQTTPCAPPLCKGSSGVGTEDPRFLCAKTCN